MIAEGINARRLCIVRKRVDFRKGHEGLLGEAFRLDLSPMNGDVIVFVGRRRDRVKILLADESGLWLQYKVLTKTRIQWLGFLEAGGYDAVEAKVLEEFVHGNIPRRCGANFR
jgi:hypothetical protein